MGNISPWIGIATLFVTIFISTIGVAFNMGRLSQRVTHLERDNADASERHDAVVRLEVEMKHAVEKLESLDRGMAGVNRQLANIATGRFKPLDATGAD